MSEDFGFALKEALVALFQEAADSASDGDPLYGVSVEDTWPAKGVQAERSILVLDFTFDEQPATMRAGGGTTDDTVSIDVGIAVWMFTAEAKAVRAVALPISRAIKALIRASGATTPVLGVTGARMPKVRTGRVVEFVLDGGRRECDIHFTVQFTGRNTATG